MATRHDAVLIRVSTDQQDTKGQIENVKKMLASRGIDIPKRHWLQYTISRGKVDESPVVQEFLRQVEAGEIANAYVESRNRLGMTKNRKYHVFLDKLESNGTRLFSLSENKELTDDSLEESLTSTVSVKKNADLLNDIAANAMRTKIAKFQKTGSWPTGFHPFGFAKRCLSSTGEKKWEWQPINRFKGVVYDFTKGGKRRKRSDALVKIPPKDRDDIIKLIPNDNRRFTRAVRMVFELFTKAGISRRQISGRLNDAGLKFYDKPFSHTYVTQILENPAYVGDTHFGRTQTGDYRTFDSEGLLVEVESVNRTRTEKQRRVEDRLVKENTHEPLVDRKTWQMAVAKRESEKKRTSYAPRNPKYYLRGIFVCGHCGKNMTARTENKNCPIYVCSTYVKGRIDKLKVPCGYYTIRHDVAEKMLLDQIEELNLVYDPKACEQVRQNLEASLLNLECGRDDSNSQADDLIADAAMSLVDYFVESYELNEDELSELKYAANSFYRYGSPSPAIKRGRANGSLPIALAEFRQAVKSAESLAVSAARREVNELERELTEVTLMLPKVTAKQQAILKRKADDLERLIEESEDRTQTVSERLAEMQNQGEAQHAKIRELQAEWPTLDAKAKGEAMKRVFDTVTLFWEDLGEGKCPRYKLRTDKTQWELTTSSWEVLRENLDRVHSERTGGIGGFVVAPGDGHMGSQ